ncbi:MAG: glycosyltransferase family 2 protein [Anaerolineae bacterium]
MKLSVIICCYNEKDSIEGVIEATAAVELGSNWEREIVVVDNFSTDGTREILSKLSQPDMQVILHEKNLGKGSSIRSGIEAMTGDYMIIQDADTEYDPAEHAKFCQKVEKENNAAVFGSRVLGGQAIYEYAHAYWGVRFLTGATNLLFGSSLTDVATATKMVRSDIIKALNLKGTTFDLDFELPCKILLAGHTIAELPISYSPRTYAEGKKITVWDGLEALKVIVKTRLFPGPLYKK